jgi:hypothetical protein
MDAAIPAITSAWIIKHILEHCIHIYSCNFEIHEPNQFAAPATCIQSFLNGVIRVQMPSCYVWVKEYGKNPELSVVIRFFQNPGTFSQPSLDAANLDPNYHQALQLGGPVGPLHPIFFLLKILLSRRCYGQTALPKSCNANF